MGRFATCVASTAANAENLPPLERTPTVSIMDALLPRRIVSIRRESPDRNAGEVPSAAHTEVKRDKHGKMIMVRHKGKSNSTLGNRENRTPADRDKTSKNGNGDGGGKDGGKSNDDGEKGWTPEHDAKIKEMKAEGKSWAQIGQELGGRTKAEASARFKEITKDDPPAVGGGEKKDEKQGKGKKNDDEAKKDEGDKGGDFTAEDDEKIKELLASSTSYRNIAEALGRTLDGPLRERITKLKGENGAGGKDRGKQKNQEGEDTKGKNKNGEGGGKKDEKPKDDSKKDTKHKEQKEKASKDNKPGKPASNAPSHRSEAKFTMREWMTLQEDDLFSFGELQLLAEIMARNSDITWLGVASEFYDKTGRRVHPEDIREKFEQMTAMGE
ncbi:hypothetical protein DOTSEDRAFT_76495 [Lecanosticta acicola]|uniref:Myb-like domain-containing protein n=1 Tax=Lecanosticta acicola TaxID=111012 RepID=A0AAI9ECP2_9PEZI|nr:hypothetical protein DOTSEDRAFT_76495 [Lecanosticta acicola]